MTEGGGAAPVWLPRDALFEILSRTLAKSVCRFRCVSKEWQAIISDPGFVSLSQLEPLLVTSYCGEKPYTDSSIVVMDMKGNIAREIKGLGAYPICASSLENLICVICFGWVTRVVDVATGKVLVASPKPKPAGGNLRKFVIRLGRAAVSGSCKAVHISEFRRAYDVQPQQTCEVLTLGGGHGADSRRAEPPPNNVRLLDCREDWAGATVNGVVHFLSRCASLDLESEEWRKTIQGPLKDDDVAFEINPIRITELNKSLCMIQSTVHGTCNIWLLVDPCSGIWVKAYSIPMRWSYEAAEPVRVMPDGANLLFFYTRPSLLTFRELATGAACLRFPFRDMHDCDEHAEVHPQQNLPF